MTRKLHTWNVKDDDSPFVLHEDFSMLSFKKRSRIMLHDICMRWSFKKWKCRQKSVRVLRRQFISIVIYEFINPNIYFNIAYAKSGNIVYLKDIQITVYLNLLNDI